MIITRTVGGLQQTIVGIGAGDVQMWPFYPRGGASFGVALANVSKRGTPAVEPPRSFWWKLRRSAVGIGILGPPIEGLLDGSAVVTDRGTEIDTRDYLDAADVEIQFQDVTALDTLLDTLMLLRHGMEPQDRKQLVIVDVDPEEVDASMERWEDVYDQPDLQPGLPTPDHRHPAADAASSERIAKASFGSAAPDGSPGSHARNGTNLE